VDLGGDWPPLGGGDLTSHTHTAARRSRRCTPGRSNNLPSGQAAAEALRPSRALFPAPLALFPVPLRGNREPLKGMNRKNIKGLLNFPFTPRPP
jgi:hypothetical protein